MFELQQVEVRIAGHVLLHPLDAQFEYGQISAILGPNGAGKSTCLRLLSGDVLPSQGQVRLNGQPLRHYSARQLARQRAVLLQQTPLPFAFTARQMVEMGRAPYAGHSTRSLDDITIRDAMQAMDVWHLKAAWFNQLSGGEKQRVLLAKTLVQIVNDNAQPAMLLLDEPLNALDMKHQIMVLEKLKQLRAEGHGIVMIEHDINLISRYADQVILLKQGRLMGQGSRQQIFQPELLQRVYDVAITQVVQDDMRLFWPSPLNPSVS